MSLGQGILSIASILALSTSIPLLGNLVDKDNPLVDHKVALLPVKNQICLLTSLQNFIKVVEGMVKRGSIDGEIVHEYLHNFFTKTMKDSRHTPLKSSRGCL